MGRSLLAGICRPAPPLAASPSAAFVVLRQWRNDRRHWRSSGNPAPNRRSGSCYDYPGYGGEQRAATRSRRLEAGDLAYDALLKHPDVDRQRIYVYGRSLGSAWQHTIRDARRRRSDLESPFTSARGMAARHYRIFPRFLVRWPG